AAGSSRERQTPPVTSVQSAGVLSLPSPAPPSQAATPSTPRQNNATPQRLVICLPREETWVAGAEVLRRPRRHARPGHPAQPVNQLLPVLALSSPNRTRTST